jgi:hypothetical protein
MATAVLDETSLPEASAPALTLCELWIGPDDSDPHGQSIRLRLLLKPASDEFREKWHTIRDDAALALSQAKAEFLDRHPSMVEMQRFEHALDDARAQLGAAQREQKTAQAAADAALAALNLDENSTQARAAREARDRADILAGQVATLESLLTRARATARHALSNAIHNFAKHAEASARQAWHNAAGLVLAAVPLDLIRRLWETEQTLEHWSNPRSWMPVVEPNKENFWDLPS